MFKINEKKIQKILSGIKLPDGKQDVISAQLISGIKINGKNLSFIIQAAEDLSPEQNLHLQKKCENAAKEISGINNVNSVLTATSGKKPVSKATAARPTPPTPKPIKNIRNVIGVASGKGGVGKSTIASNLAVALAKAGHKTGLVDADIQGPSIARMMNIIGKPDIENNQMIPPICHGVKCLSMGSLLDESAPAVWRGAMVTKALKQLMADAAWGTETEPLDVLVVDLPPGTGDIHLTIAQNFCVDGVVMVTTPQQVALMDVKKAASMFEKLKIPVLGLVENMAYIENAGEKIASFGDYAEQGPAYKWCSANEISFITSLPLDNRISFAADNGKPFAIAYEDNSVNELYDKIADRIDVHLSR